MMIWILIQRITDSISKIMASHLNNNYILEVSLTIGAYASNSTGVRKLINADNLSQDNRMAYTMGLIMVQLYNDRKRWDLFSNAVSNLVILHLVS